MELIEVFGNELTVVNAARASFDVFKSEMDDSDRKLIKCAPLPIHPRVI